MNSFRDYDCGLGDLRIAGGWRLVMADEVADHAERSQGSGPFSIKLGFLADHSALLIVLAIGS